MGDDEDEPSDCIRIEQSQPCKYLYNPQEDILLCIPSDGTHRDLFEILPVNRRSRYNFMGHISESGIDGFEITETDPNRDHLHKLILKLMQYPDFSRVFKK
jgi:hypothetical protein